MFDLIKARDIAEDFAQDLAKEDEEFWRVFVTIRHACNEIEILRVDLALALTENVALRRVADAAQLIAYPRGFRDGNVPDDLHRALAALPARGEKPEEQG